MHLYHFSFLHCIWSHLHIKPFSYIQQYQNYHEDCDSRLNWLPRTRTRQASTLQPQDHNRDRTLTTRNSTTKSGGIISSIRHFQTQKRHSKRPKQWLGKRWERQERTRWCRCGYLVCFFPSNTEWYWFRENRTIAITPAKAQTSPWNEVEKVCRDYAVNGQKILTELPRSENSKPLRFVYLSGVSGERDPSKKPWILGQYSLLRVSFLPRFGVQICWYVSGRSRISDPFLRNREPKESLCHDR